MCKLRCISVCFLVVLIPFKEERKFGRRIVFSWNKLQKSSEICVVQKQGAEIVSEGCFLK